MAFIPTVDNCLIASVNVAKSLNKGSFMLPSDTDNISQVYERVENATMSSSVENRTFSSPTVASRSRDLLLDQLLLKRSIMP